MRRCKSDKSAAEGTNIHTMELVRLDDSLYGFIDVFNLNSGKPRFVALMSPT